MTATLSQFSQNSDITRARILVLDNSWQHRDLAVEALGQLGVENILPCSTPGEALQKMSKFKPDLIFMEINLQRSAGLNFLRRVRAGQSHADVDVPVILTSLSVERVMMTKAAEAGFENFVRKPFNIETVQQRVSGTLDNPDRVVLASDYFGPNRREDGRTSEYSGKDRRQTVMKVSVSYEASPETAKRSSRNEAASADSTASNQNQQTEPAQEENIKPAASLRREAPPPPVKLVAIEPPLKEIPANEAPVKPAARPPVKARPEVPAMSAEEKAKQKIKDEMADHALWLTSKGAKGQKANFRGADLSGMDLSGAELASAGLRDADLQDCDLTGANLFDADLRGAALGAALLNKTNLHNAKMRHANLRNAKLNDAELRGADLSGADLSLTVMTGADLDHANFMGANLAGADLAGTNLTQKQIERALGDKATKLPPGLRLPVPDEGAS